MLKIDCKEYNIKKMRELCGCIGVSQGVADRFEAQDIEEICLYADSDGNIDLSIGIYMSADTVGLTVSNPEMDTFDHHLLLTSINVFEEGPFWEMPLEYARFILKMELSSRGLAVHEYYFGEKRNV